MHLVFWMRGIKHCADQLVNDLQAQFFSVTGFQRTEGQHVHGGVQGALRPIQLYEYVFPKEHYSTVVKSLNAVPSANEKLNRTLDWQRRLMRLKKLPEVDPKAPIRALRKANVSIHPIGIKEDEEGPTDETNKPEGNKNLIQERI